MLLDLREAGRTSSEHGVAGLMRQGGPRTLPGFPTRRWAVGKPSILIPNVLQRQLTVTRRNRAWVTDVPYIRACQRWLYLAVIMNRFPREVIGSAAGRR